jgi:hypothetical protein
MIVCRRERKMGMDERVGSWERKMGMDEECGMI